MTKINFQDIEDYIKNFPELGAALVLVELNNTLDERLSELVTSEKTIEGLLKDIRAELDRGGGRIVEAINEK